MLQQVCEGDQEVWTNDGTLVYNHANHLLIIKTANRTLLYEHL